MPEWLGFALLVAAVGGVFWVGLWLLRRSQADDPSQRGRDADEPPGFSNTTDHQD